jgi:hypothetical protein
MKPRLPAACAEARGRPPQFHSLLVEPHIELGWIKPHELANFEEWDPPFGHEASDMPARHPESLGNAVDVQKRVANVCPGN